MLCSGQGSSPSRYKNDGDSWILVGNKKLVTSLHPRRTPTFHLRDLRGLVIRMDFGPAFGSLQGRYKTAIAVRAAAFVARDLLLVAPPPRETPTSHPRRPDVPLWPCQCVRRCTDGLRPLLILARRAGRLLPFDALCVRHARVSARPVSLAGRPAGELC